MRHSPLFLALLLGSLILASTEESAAFEPGGESSPKAAPSEPGESSASFVPRRPERRTISRDAEATAPAVVVDVVTGQSFPDLQQAITAAAPGALLEVRGGTLMEGQVLIDKDLTIRGATGSEIVAMAVNTGNTGDARGWFVVADGVELTVRDLTFDGNGHLVYQAFRHRGSGSFVNCRFRDIQFNPETDFQGTAIVAFGGNVDVIDSTFEQIGRVGVLAFGTGITASVIVGNAYTGKGDGAFLDYAFEANAGAQVLIIGNTVSGNRGIAPDDSQSAAVLATTANGAGTIAIIEENTFLTNDLAVAIGFSSMVPDGTLAALSHNRSVDNLTGLVSVSSAAVPAENNWWGCNGGPGIVGCDPLTGTGAIDADPWLVFQITLPSLLPVKRDTAFLANLIFNSDGVDTSAFGHVPDGNTVTFEAGTLGTVLPATVLALLAGATDATFAAGAVTGNSQLTATIDNETLIIAYEVTASIFNDGFESGNTSTWSATVP